MCQNDVDNQHLKEGGERGRFSDVGKIVDDMRPDSVGAAECRRRGARRHQKIKHDRSTRPAAYWFIDSKKSSLVLESLILSSRNSIASTVPICISSEERRVGKEWVSPCNTR